MSELHIIEILAGLNVIQAGFWGYQVHTLVNKLMCKNLAEYDLIKKGPPKSTPQAPDDMSEESAILAELNGMLPGSVN